MGQHWKTLSLVVLVAAIAGWWVVRAVGERAPAPPASPLAMASGQAPEPTAEPVAAVEPAAAATPVATPKPGDIPVVISEEAEVAAIQRDLAQLQQALVRDQRIEDRVMPRVNDALDVSGVTTYRRATAFWEPALAEPNEPNERNP